MKWGINMKNTSYSGWKIYDKVKIMLSNYVNTYCGIQCQRGQIYTEEKAKEAAGAHLIETDNGGFNLRIVCPVAKNFWDCLITKGDLQFFTSLYVSTISELLMYSTFVNGVCSEPVMFGSYKSRIGVLHKGMPIYQQIMAEEALKVQAKTSKWEIGRLYSTKTKTDVLLGYFPYVQCDIVYKRNDGHVSINLDAEPRKVAIVGSYQTGDTLDYVVANGLGYGITVNYMESLPLRVAGEKLFDEQQIMWHFINYIRNKVDDYMLDLKKEIYGFRIYEHLKLILIVYYINREIGKDLIFKFCNMVKNLEKEFMYEKVASDIVVFGEKIIADNLRNIVIEVGKRLINK